MKKLIVLLSLALFLNSCGVQKSLTDQWRGKTKQELILAEGPPARTESDGGEGSILIYERNAKLTVSRAANGRAWTENVLHKVKTMYFVDKEGKIYNVLSKSEPIE